MPYHLRYVPTNQSLVPGSADKPSPLLSSDGPLRSHLFVNQEVQHIDHVSRVVHVAFEKAHEIRDAPIV